MKRVLLTSMGLVLGCGGKVIFDGDGAGASGNGVGGSAANATGATAPTGGAATPNLLPICKKFCNAYQHCAPITDCMNGCLVSAVHGCEKQYAGDVICITSALQGCTVPPDDCVAEGDAYLACQMTSSSSGG